MVIVELIVGVISKTTKIAIVMIVVELMMIDEEIPWIASLIVDCWPFVEEQMVVRNHNLTKRRTARG